MGLAAGCRPDSVGADGPVDGADRDSLVRRPVSFLRSVLWRMVRRAFRVAAGRVYLSAQMVRPCSGWSGSVGVADLVGLPGPPAARHPVGQHLGDGHSGGVVLACLGNEPVVGGGQRGVDSAGMLGGVDQRVPQVGVAGLGRSNEVAAGAGLVDGGDQTGEGPHAGEVGEPLGVAQTAQDGGPPESLRRHRRRGRTRADHHSWRRRPGPWLHPQRLP
jgi:hypothetical protein